LIKSIQYILYQSLENKAMALAETTEVKTVDLTAAAADAVKDLLKKRELDDYALRIYVQGGGCSGFQYGMALENKIRDSDIVVEEFGVKVVIDEVSIGYMSGASIDYVEDDMGSGFKIENPNSMSSFGCGTSAEAQDGGGTPSCCSGCG
jgi:iron-sulfur cluster assembly protein